MHNNNNNRGSSSMVLIFPKLLFFTVTISGVCWNRFSNLYFSSHGLTTTNIGDLKSIGFLLKFVTQPLWGYLGDYVGVKRALLGSFVFAAVSLFLLRLHLEYVMSHSALTADGSESDSVATREAAFHVVAFWRILRGAANAISPLTGAYVVQILAADDSHNEGYGRQRLFASLAWGIGAVLAGGLIDVFTLDTILFNFTYIGCGVNMLLLLVRRDATPDIKIRPSDEDLTSSLELRQLSVVDVSVDVTVKKVVRAGPMPMRKADSDVSLHNAANGKASACSSIRQHAEGAVGVWRLGWSRFGAQVVLFSFVMVLVDTITPLEVDVLSDGSRFLNGLLVAVACFAGVPVFWVLSPAIYRRDFHGWMMTASMCVLAIRLGILVALPAAGVATSVPPPVLWLALVAQSALDALCLPVVWLTAVEHVHQRIAETMSSTASQHAASAQVVVGTLYYTIGQGFGNMIWGRLHDRYGAHCIYLAGITLLGLNLVLVGPYRGECGGVCVRDLDELVVGPK